MKCCGIADEYLLLLLLIHLLLFLRYGRSALYSTQRVFYGVWRTRTVPFNNERCLDEKKER